MKKRKYTPHPCSEETKIKISIALKGKKHSEETKRRLSESHKGKKPSLETRKKLSLAKLGKKTGNQSEETKRKISATLKGKRHPFQKRPWITGEKHWKWKGGVSVNSHLKKKEKLAGRPKSERCEICGSNESICFDHNHKTGEFRGWICSKCNKTLGFAEDNIKRLELLILYLQKFEN